MNLMLIVASAAQAENSGWKVNVSFFATTLVFFFVNDKDIEGNGFIFLAANYQERHTEDDDFVCNEVKKGCIFPPLHCVCASLAFS